MNKIGCVEEVQGAFIRSFFPRAVGAITPAVYAAAHQEWARRNQATIHDSSYPLVMEVNHGRWNPMCPECASGVCTGRLWNVARCFGCGAVFNNPVWPLEADAIEVILMKRPPRFRHWKPEESPALLLAENVQHGVVTAVNPLLAPAIKGFLESRES